MYNFYNMYILEFLGPVRQSWRHSRAPTAGAFRAELCRGRASRRPHRGGGKASILPFLL